MLLSLKPCLPALSCSFSSGHGVPSCEQSTLYAFNHKGPVGSFQVEVIQSAAVNILVHALCVLVNTQVHFCWIHTARQFSKMVVPNLWSH